MSRAAQPHLEVQGGVIVMIASIYGREAGGGPSYNAAKAAEISLAKAMARDLAARIRVLSVAPGSVVVPGRRMGAPAEGRPRRHRRVCGPRHPLGRFGRVEEIADVVTFACSPRGVLDHRGLHPGGRRAVAGFLTGRLAGGVTRRRRGAGAGCSRTKYGLRIVEVLMVPVLSPASTAFAQPFFEEFANPALTTTESDVAEAVYASLWVTRA